VQRIISFGLEVIHVRLLTPLTPSAP